MGSKILKKDDIKLYFHPAKDKKHNETVVFVHHMLGSHKSTARHYRYLNELGFDCVSFDLLLGSSRIKKRYHPLLKYIYKGVFYIWTQQIRFVLNQINGDKILFAFSGPCLSAIWASDKRGDVKKLICDGGPFHKIYLNSKNFFSNVLNVRREPLNSIVAFFGTSLWGYKPIKKLHKVLSLWPTDRPVLSIRGCHDDIVSLESIRQVFKNHDNIDLSVLELPDGKHLNGLRDFPEEYKKSLNQFLN